MNSVVGKSIFPQVQKWRENKIDIEFTANLRSVKLM